MSAERFCKPDGYKNISSSETRSMDKFTGLEYRMDVDGMALKFDQIDLNNRQDDDVEEMDCTIL